MPAKLPPSDFDSLQAEIVALFQEDHSKIRMMVPISRQEKEIRLLKETEMSDDRFFFVVNMLRFELEGAHGVGKWLGYPEREFTLKQYWDRVVHPSRRQSLLLIARQMYTVLCRGAYPLEFMVQRFSTLVPLRHYSGHYILAKKTASVFQYDERNRLMAYMDEFTIINHDYQGEPLQPVMYNSRGAREEQKEQEIMQQVMKRFADMKVFARGEMQAIRLLAYNPNLTQEEIATKLELATSTIDTYYGRFLDKARIFYDQDFSSVRHAALYLKREGLI